MDINKLRIQNFLTIGEASVDLNNRGLLLIQGKNEDDPSAESNGAGKSSIVDALCWAIYGVTARGVTSDAVVNKTIGKDCVVTVIIGEGSSHGDIGYEITRYRKHATGKNQVTIRQGVLGRAGWIDMSKGTDRETQDVINQVMGCSLDVFMAAVYAGQEKMPDLPGMTDKMLKTLIEEAAGVEELTSAYAIARERNANATANLATSKNHLKDVKFSLDVLSADIVTNTTNFKEFEEGRKNRAKAELIKTMPIKKKIEELEAWSALNPIAPILDNLDKLEAKLKGKSDEEDELKLLDNATNASYKTMAAKLATAEGRKEDLKKAFKSLDDIDNHVGTPCGECGKEYHAEDLVKAKAIATTKTKYAEDELFTANAELKTSESAYKTASEAAKSFKASMTDYTKVVQLQRELDSKANEIRSVENELKGLKREIDSINAMAKVKLTETNAWAKVLESKEADFKAYTVQREFYDNEVTIRTLAVELLDDAVKVFGPAGVRAHILDTVTPYLNERTQEYLGALADGNIHAEWNTLSKTAKGELREKFNIEVTNDKGADNFIGLSGGEKRKVRLATAMALQDMVASRATKPINIFIADEVDHALDEHGLERLMGVLERKARERGTVLVISHNSLSDWIDNVVTVTKSGGLATLDGATKNGF